MLSSDDSYFQYRLWSRMHEELNQECQVARKSCGLIRDEVVSSEVAFAAAGRPHRSRLGSRTSGLRNEDSRRSGKHSG